MRRFNLEIITENDAFADGTELPRLLRSVANDMHVNDRGNIADVNGNTVGRWSYEPISEWKAWVNSVA